MSDSGYQIRVLKQLLSLLAKEEGGKDKSRDSSESYAGGAKEVLSNLAGLAGKGKDELIQSICREIGQATAAVLKEPLAQLLKDRKLQVTIEFVPVKNDKEKYKDKDREKFSSKKKPPRSDFGSDHPKGQGSRPNPNARRR